MLPERAGRAGHQSQGVACARRSQRDQMGVPNEDIERIDRAPPPVTDGEESSVREADRRAGDQKARQEHGVTTEEEARRAPGPHSQREDGAQRDGDARFAHVDADRDQKPGGEERPPASARLQMPHEQVRHSAGAQDRERLHVHDRRRAYRERKQQVRGRRQQPHPGIQKPPGQQEDQDSGQGLGEHDAEPDQRIIRADQANEACEQIKVDDPARLEVRVGHEPPQDQPSVHQVGALVGVDGVAAPDPDAKQRTEHQNDQQPAQRTASRRRAPGTGRRVAQRRTGGGGWGLCKDSKWYCRGQRPQGCYPLARPQPCEQIHAPPKCLAGRGAVRLARLLREQEVPGSNPGAPISSGLISRSAIDARRPFTTAAAGSCRT